MIGKKIIDLTMLVDNSISGVSIEQAKTKDADGWNATTLHLYSHSGTHMDAPLHFEVNNQTIDKIPVHRFISEAWVVDLTNIQPKELITVTHLNSISDVVEKGQSILLKTGWSKKVGTDEYRNALPRISSDLAHWLGEKGINMLGIEPISVADVNNLEEVTEIHTILMKNDIIIVEGLTNLNEISKNKVTLVALPLKIGNGDGAPTRVIAIEE
ncbi:cyclase family protein [Aurantibacter crassamenti]|uniref:cyclase family protein n=1 Tax=Aurantibacter crassamenti TaxID=1837375 RepID=UPI00193A7B38|nr:cyclase family protein [Aurantibacter crassamenti]MBM1105881.1 cyclase family protein [Aurantibacter crassamenti]